MIDAIELAESDPGWAAAFAEECARVGAALGEAVVTIHHIGSTAVPGLLAKPVIDIAIEAASLEAIDAAIPAMTAIGYAAKGENGIAGRRYFVKRNAAGARSHHVHVFETGAQQVVRHIVFRDHLIAHPEIAAEYAALKRAIVAGGAARRSDYVAAKEVYIARLVDSALSQ